jgi:four helix bundle protein
MGTAQERNAFGFEDLEVYKAARALRRRVYKLVKLLPPEEKYDLAPQMRRAAVSLTNNIAEGHGRYHWQDNTRFCRLARGSLCEIADDINVCEDQGYADPEHLRDLKSDAAEVLRLLNGYIAYLQRQRNADRGRR